MKLTRRQLRKIISEAMFDPGAASIGAMERLEDEHGEETADAIRRLYRTDNPEDSTSADELTSSLVGKFFPSDDFEEDVKDYKSMFIKPVLPDTYTKLSNDQLEALSNVYGKDVMLDLNVVDAIQVTTGGESFLGLGEELPGLGGPDLYNIIDTVYKGLIPLKLHVKGNAPRIDDFNEAQRRVLRAIISLSNKTNVSSRDSEEMGITVYNSETSGQDINPEFEELVQAGKLILN
jgi:hypothetical protein